MPNRAFAANDAAAEAPGGAGVPNRAFAAKRCGRRGAWRSLPLSGCSASSFMPFSVRSMLARCSRNRLAMILDSLWGIASSAALSPLRPGPIRIHWLSTVPVDDSVIVKRHMAAG